jgi:hypothetical protein
MVGKGAAIRDDRWRAAASGSEKSGIILPFELTGSGEKATLRAGTSLAIAAASCAGSPDP